MRVIEKRKGKKSETTSVDESGLAKSAAWAWYEHGSGLEGRPVREVDAWRAKTEPKPSRYKLEALRNLESINSSKNSLLDTYEIERISKHLDFYIEESHVKHHGGDPANDKRKIVRGFRWRQHVPLACSSSTNDVVECRKKLPEKSCVPVVRPRPFRASSEVGSYTH